MTADMSTWPTVLRESGLDGCYTGGSVRYE